VSGAFARSEAQRERVILGTAQRELHPALPIVHAYAEQDHTPRAAARAYDVPVERAVEAVARSRFEVAVGVKTRLGRAVEHVRNDTKVFESHSP
jgi:hypothetical protein